MWSEWSGKVHGQLRSEQMEAGSTRLDALEEVLKRDISWDMIAI
jgi:hypothetical protein